MIRQCRSKVAPVWAGRARFSGSVAPSSPRWDCDSRSLDERFDLRGGTGAAFTDNLFAAAEHGERWNRPDSEPLTELRERVGIDLDDESLAGLSRRHLLQLWRDHPARTAPWR